VRARFEIPEGWTVQAFGFTLDPTEDQSRMLAWHFGARRKAYNWTVAALKADIEAWQATGVETAKPSLRVMRKRWNTVKDEVCVNAETGAGVVARVFQRGLRRRHRRRGRRVLELAELPIRHT
jgi:putative transposase